MAFPMRNTECLKILFFVTYLANMWVTIETALAKCIPLDQCSCKVETTGKIISLQDIDRRRGPPRFINIQSSIQDQYKYFYNPCTSVYQVATSGAYFNLGEPKLHVRTLKLTDLHYQFYYVGKNRDNKERTAFITLVCKPTAEEAVIGKFTEGPQYNYTVALTTKCACPGGCSYDANYFTKDNTANNRLSVGSTLCILWLSSFILYMLSGILYNKCTTNKKGMQIIPHWTLWRALPYLVKKTFWHKNQGVEEFVRSHGLSCTGRKEELAASSFMAYKYNMPVMQTGWMYVCDILYKRWTLQ